MSDSKSDDEVNYTFDDVAKRKAEEEAKEQADEARDDFSDISGDEYNPFNFDLDDALGDEESVIAKSTAVFLEKEKERATQEKEEAEDKAKTRNSDDNDDKKKNTFDRSKQFDQYRKDTINEAKKNFFEKSKNKIGKTNFINLENNRQFLYPKLNGTPISIIFQITKTKMKLKLAYHKRYTAGTREKDLAKHEKKIETWKTWRNSDNVEGWKNVLLGLLKDATDVEKEIIYKTLILFLVKDDPYEAIDYAAKMTNQENINKREYIYKDEYQKVYQRNTTALRKKYNTQSSLKKQKLELQECMSNLKF